MMMEKGTLADESAESGHKGGCLHGPVVVGLAVLAAKEGLSANMMRS
jgi:hypothetical protein